MLHFKTYYLNVPEKIELSRVKATPDNSTIIRFCNHTVTTYAPIVNKLSKVFLNIELGVKKGYIKDISYITIILPQNSFRKFKSTDEENTLKRFRWFIENLEPTTNGMVISLYISKDPILDRMDSHWDLNNLWISKEKWKGKGDYVTVQLPEKVGNFWNQHYFYENWSFIEKYLISKNIEIKYISYKDSIDKVYELLLNTKLHISYIGSTYFIGSLARVPTIGLGKSTRENTIRYYRNKNTVLPYVTDIRRNAWGTGCMASNRITQINENGNVYNGFVYGSIDVPSIHTANRLVRNVIENDNYKEFWCDMVKYDSHENIEFKNEPWPYFYIDNYLSEKEFEWLKSKAMDVNCRSDRVSREILKYDFTPQIELLFKIFEERKDIPKREYTNLKKFIHFAVTPANFVHDMHIEAPFKIMSAVLYLGPAENRGTRLYKTPNEAPFEVEWKPNRLFVFCGHDHTLHDYLSSSVRYTYNYFLVDEPIVENLEYKRNLIDLEYINE